MSRCRFLFDEDVSLALTKALRQEQPAIDILHVGEAGAPPKRTPDSDLLVFAEATSRGLITRDRRTMPGHIADHLARGRHTWGVFILRRGFPLRRYIEDLLLIWSASEADEWQDRVESIPWAQPP